MRGGDDLELRSRVIMSLATMADLHEGSIRILIAIGAGAGAGIVIGCYRGCMTPGEVTTSPSALSVRMRRDERTAALVGVAATAISGTGLIIFFMINEAPSLIRPLLLSIGVGCFTAMFTLTLKLPVLVGASTPVGGTDIARMRAMQRAVLADNTSSLSPKDAAQAPRWAAIMALRLREQLMCSGLLIAGLICVCMTPDTFAGALSPFGWGLVLILVVLLGVDQVLLTRQRRMHEFATRHGAWAL